MHTHAKLKGDLITALPLNKSCVSLNYRPFGDSYLFFMSFATSVLNYRVQSAEVFVSLYILHVMAYWD